MKQLGRFQAMLQACGAVMALCGAALFAWQPRVAAVAFSVGVLLFCPMQMLQRYEGRNFILRRLRRQQLLGATALLCTACCMLMQAFEFGPARRNEWLVCLAIGCVLELYTAFRIPAELEKEK
ncbi:MAG: hypothetical protein II746_10180 [Bacteroidaceae bacterium]|nr:hypothetical protein [Bacteroidaceae bacterium]